MGSANRLRAYITHIRVRQRYNNAMLLDVVSGIISRTEYFCCIVRTVECNFHVLQIYRKHLFFLESKTNLFVHNRKLTDNYRNFTFIRTYFSSSKTTTT